MIYSANQKDALIADVNKFFRLVEGGKLDVVRAGERRTPGQQSLLHILIREIAIYVGVGELEMKENILKRNSEGVFPHWPHDIEKTLPKRLKKKSTGHIYGIPGMVPKPESKLTKNEEIELIDRLYQLGVEWGVEFSDNRGASFIEHVRNSKQAAARREQVA